MQDAIICDLDGTLYDAAERQREHLMGAKKDFDAFHRAAENDQPHFWCAELIQAMRAIGCRIIFSSGRDNTYQMQTEKWLQHHLNIKVGQYDLYMRPRGDYTADDVMKEGWLPLIRSRYRILFAVDDRKRVAEMWRRNGITCLHCAEGNF